MPALPHIELDATSPDSVDGRHIRALAFQAVRLEYVRSVLARTGPGPSATTPTLVVGNGHGPLAASLSALGLDVTAADPSAAATEIARTESAAAHRDVRHIVAPADELPFDADTFGFVYLADTLEVHADLDAVVEEAARVLRGGGTLVYDTVNRTWPAKLVYLGAFQTFPATRIMPPGRYASDRLRPPAELDATLARHGLTPGGVCGFKPKNPRRLVTATRHRRQGRITDEQVAPMVEFVLDPDHPPVVTYFGHARKP